GHEIRVRRFVLEGPQKTGDIAVAGHLAVENATRQQGVEIERRHDIGHLVWVLLDDLPWLAHVNPPGCRNPCRGIFCSDCPGAWPPEPPPEREVAPPGARPAI